MSTYTTYVFRGSLFPCEEIIAYLAGWRVHVDIKNDDSRPMIALHYTSEEGEFQDGAVIYEANCKDKKSQYFGRTNGESLMNN
jgi:hypothetical protein